MKGFLLYDEWRDHFAILSAEEAGALVMALFAWRQGEEPSSELSPAAKMAYSFITAQMERDRQQYIETCERNRENGSKGGRPKKPTGFSENRPVSEKTAGFFEKPKKPNEKEKENKNIKYIPPYSPPTGETACFDGESLKVEMAGGDAEDAINHSKTQMSERFTRFWEAYPRKVGKGAAEKAFGKIKPSQALVDQMIEAIKAQSKSSQWQEGYIPNPTTWLNQKRWEDDLSKENTAPQKRASSFDADEWDRETRRPPRLDGMSDNGPRIF